VAGQIEDPAAWTVADIGGKDGLSLQLTERDFAAFDALLDATAGTPLSYDSPQWPNPGLDALAAEVRSRLFEGRGIVILSRVDLDRYSVDDYKRIYWEVGRRLGRPAIQSEKLEQLGLVRQEKENPFGRGYIKNVELRPHTDLHEILSLASVSVADRGGESCFASALAIHDVLEREHPELLPPLYKGYYSGIRANYGYERGPDDVEDVPVFCNVDGKLSCYLHEHYMGYAARARGEAIPEPLTAAMDEVVRVAERPDLLAEFRLEPGEMAFWHNWLVFHARRAFENKPGRERMLMRLWLHPAEGRPVHPAIARQAHLIDEIHRDVHDRDRLAEAATPR
jgi:hypothetical protein